MHKNIGSPRLVRLLGNWMPADGQASRRDVAERLGQWLNVRDVVTLHAAQQSIASVGAAPPSGTPDTEAFDAEGELRRLRSALEKSITEEAATLRESDTGYAHYHRRYLGHQRRMASNVDALRGRLRQRLSTVSPRLAQLAVLDALLEQILGARQYKLLSTVPLFLRQRYEQLHRQGAGDAATVPLPLAWLDTFAWDFQEALLAELEVRLQPVLGMIDALNHDVKQNQ